MNKLEANISLFIITFFAAVQYVFLAWVPESVSRFAFLCVTNLVGFLMTLAFFWGELFRLDRKQIGQSLALSAELVVFNVFLLLGVAGVGPTVTAAVLSAYFVFIVALSALLFRQRPNGASLWGSAVILLGLFLMMDADVMGLWNRNILYLIIADGVFALYIITAGLYASSSNPSILAMGQTFFCFLIALAFWAWEAVFNGVPFSLPVSPEFWGSVLFISFFIRGLYGVVQIYAQRYVTPLNTSLIFATEIVMTMAVSPVLTRLFGTAPERITLLKIAGSVVMVAGLFMAEPSFMEAAKQTLSGGFKSSRPIASGRKGSRHYCLFSLLLASLLGGCGWLLGGPLLAWVYGILGVLAGIPITILLEGVLCLTPLPDDASFVLQAGVESQNDANAVLEETAREQGIGMKRIFEIQSCLEELSIRIFNAMPEASIRVRIRYGEAVSLRLSWEGEKHNPLRIGPDEDALDVAALKIIRHRALQASFGRRDGENRVHVVV